MKKNLKHVVAVVGATALCIFAVVPTDVFAKNIGPYAWKGAWSTNQSGEITRNVKDNTSSVRTVINEMSSSISSIRMSIYASKNYYNEKATYYMFVVCCSL